MPPSPAMRYSPGREVRGDNNHKRGRSLEGRILIREKDDDLALFNEMQTRERDNFLLQSNDDFEDILSTKSRYFSDYKLGIAIPMRGEGSDLLNVDGEKDDYDWLLTPPDTPLFASLDDEAPPVTLAQRGRPRTQPITISRSSTMEKSQRSSRGSPSPNRLSPSPQSGNSMFQTRGRPSSAPHSGPTPSLRHATASQRPSPPPSKPSTPVPRSSTPTSHRTSTGSRPVSSSGVRGTSPVNTSRGNSASPKVRAWKTNIPGFSLEAPPNLRTSLADRPASYVRGSLPASRNGRDFSSRSGRQSMSPTASRSVSSSNSHDRDRLSSQSKGSAASSGDDDVDSLQSVHMSSSGRSASRRIGAFPSNKAPAFSKKPTRTGLSSSAPKRSFDSALRQMDHQKGPQNMFRPLLSSVPSSTFYAGKAGAVHRALISRNTSVTSSSNASSDQGIKGAHDIEGSDQNQDDMVSECGKAPYLDVHSDIFNLEMPDVVNEDISPGVHDRSPDVQHCDFKGGARVKCQLGSSENFDYHGTHMASATTCEVSVVKGNIPEVYSTEDMVRCSICGRSFDAMDLTEEDLKLCPDCKSSDEPLTATSPVPTTAVSENSPRLWMKISDEHLALDAAVPLLAVSESSKVTNVAEARAAQHEENVREAHTSYAERMAEEDAQLANQKVIGQTTIGSNPSGGDPEVQQTQQLSNYPNLKLDVSEGAGISILLKRSSSSNGPVVQGRTFTATSVAYDDLFYVRDAAPSMRSSFGQGSISASSSVDLGSARRTETRLQRQLSGRRSDIETYGKDRTTKHKRSGSSLSGTSAHAFQVSVACVGDDVMCQEQLLASESAGLCDTCPEAVYNNDYGTMATTTLDIYSADSSVVSFSNVEDSPSGGNCEEFQIDTRILDRETSSQTPEPSTVKEDEMPNSIVDRLDVAVVSTQTSLDTISEIEMENGQVDSRSPQSDVGSQNSVNTMDELPEPSIDTSSDTDITASVTEPDTLDHAHGFLEESTVEVEGHGRTKSRSLTLDEATDTILFCSSIIHNLAYEAATIAMEKENSVPLEGSRPTVTILGNSNYDRKDPWARTAGKRSSKSQKARQRRVETDAKPPSGNMDGDENAVVSTTRIVGVPNKGDNMKPPKLESKCNCTVM